MLVSAGFEEGIHHYCWNLRIVVMKLDYYYSACKNQWNE
jgi:hypothetical protein